MMKGNACVKIQEKATAQGLKEWPVLIMMDTVPSAFPKTSFPAVKLRNETVREGLCFHSAAA